MSTEKTTSRENLPFPNRGGEDSRTKSQQDQLVRHSKPKIQGERKPKQVHYIIKDLPIY